MLKENVKLINKNGIHFQIDDSGKLIHYQSWKGNAVAFCYDWIMDKILMPKKLAADNNKHYSILKNMLKYEHGKKVLELAAGSGSAEYFLPADNLYSGSDVSLALLKRAVKKLTGYFTSSKFYLMSADDLVFSNDQFDLILCVLSLNFFPDLPKAVNEMQRVLIPGGKIVCCVPVSNRNHNNAKINGDIYTEKELENFFTDAGFSFHLNPCSNGAILYFSAVKVT